MKDGNLIIFQDRTLFRNRTVWHCRTSKCPLDMSINWTCAAHRAVYITKWGSNCAPPTSLQSLLHRRCWASHTWPNKCSCLVRFSIAPWTRTIRSSSDVAGVPYTMLFIGSTTPQKIVHRCQIWCPRNWSPATNPSIWICNVEVNLHISIKVCIWPKGCIPAALGHQNEW